MDKKPFFVFTLKINGSSVMDPITSEELIAKSASDAFRAYYCRSSSEGDKVEIYCNGELKVAFTVTDSN